MSKIITGTELQQWLEEQRLKFQRKKEIEKQRQKKEKAEKKEARKKREEKQQKQKAKEREKQQRQQQREEKILHHSIYVRNRTLQIYRTNGRRSKFSSDSDLYNSWEEIRYAEDKENGRINWERLPLLIEETKKLINGEGKTKRR